VLLTLARMWRTAKDGAFVSKARAAEWARPQLSRTASDVLALAREEYLGARSVDWSNRSVEVQTAALELAQRIRATL
jgi:streptomycin 3"-adenylyltransferase